jgi:hypothetical protein
MELMKAKEECAQAKEELSQMRSLTKSEKEEWQMEVDQLREKLHRANQEKASKSTEKIRDQQMLHDEVSRHVVEIKELKEMISSKDSELDAKSKKLAELEEDFCILRNGFEGNTEMVSNLTSELDDMKTKESDLSKELKIYKLLFQDIKCHPDACESQVFFSCIDDDLIKRLKQQLENVDENRIGSTIRDEISELKRRISGSGKQSRGIVPLKTEARFAQIEQTFLNEIAVLKAKLAASQSKIQEETYRAQEERRINREREAERIAELERLRREKQHALSAKHNLLVEVTDLRKRLSNELPTIAPIPVKKPTEDITGVPNNVRRLRNELAQARERLAAARENSRALPLLTINTVPSGIRAENLNLQSDLGTQHLNTDFSGKDSVSTKSSGSSWTPVPNAPDDASVDSGGVSATITAFRAAHSTRPPSRPATLSMEELTKQLEASRKRLESADLKLTGLVNDGSLLTIVRQNPYDTSLDGSIDEVVETDGPDGNGIEVSHRRFADV